VNGTGLWAGESGAVTYTEEKTAIDLQTKLFDFFFLIIGIIPTMFK
jgi:hypothetical protein